MKKIGLWMYTNDGGDYYRQQLIRRLQDCGHEVVSDFDMRRCYVENGRVFTEAGVDLSALDVLYYMNADERSDYQQDILNFIELSGVKLINSAAAYCNAADKARTNMILKNAGLRVADSLLIGAGCSAATVKRFFEKYGRVVLKKRIGGGGRGIMKFERCEDLLDFLGYAEGKFTDYYLEQFIEFSGRDYRVSILDGAIVEVYSRSSDYFKTNIHCAHGKAGFLPVDNPQPYIEIARQAVQLLKIDATIVDMVVGSRDNEIYILEVNELLGMFIPRGMHNVYDIEAANEQKLNGIVTMINKTRRYP